MAIRERAGRLYHDFYFYLPNGSRTRAFEPAGQDTKKNRSIAKSKDKAIQYHIKVDSFHYPDFFPHGAKIKHYHNTGTTYSEWWSKIMAEVSNRPSTVLVKNYLHNKHVIPYFGDMPLSDISEHHLLVFRKSMALGPATVNLVISHMCFAMNKAYKRGVIDINPCADITPLTAPKTDIQPFSFDELNRWLSVCNSEWHDMILIWSRTGFRPGELVALKWEDVDFFNKAISVRRTRGVHGDGPPKTPSSNRDLPMRPDVIKALKRQMERTGLAGGYIFSFKGGNQIRRKLLIKKFKHQLRLAGLKTRTPSQMRHTFATLHIAAGESISWVSMMLGHANVKITLERYNKYIPDLTRDDGSAFEKALCKAEKGNIKVTRLATG